MRLMQRVKQFCICYLQKVQKLICVHAVSGDMIQLKKVQSEEAYFIIGQYVLFHFCVMQIHDELLYLNFGKPVESYVTVACFLVCEGADRYIRDKNYGVTPFQVCPQEVGAIVTTFQRRNR